MNKQKTIQFVNPFSEKFLDYWEIWKNFKLEEFKFTYKGVTSQQMAVKHLVDLSGGDEEKAIKIISQSVRRGWQGFYPLHETTNGNGKSKQSNPKGNTGSDSIEARVADEFNKRFGNWEQGSNGSNLKAV